MHFDTTYIALACIFGITLTWSVGANDLANIMSTTIGSHAINVRTAIIIAIVFEFAGAFLGGKEVSNTLRGGIINTNDLILIPYVLLYGMLAVLSSGTIWMLLASYFGMPVSITNTIVGAIVGFGLVVIGAEHMEWHIVIAIMISWLASPSIAALVGYLIFISIQRSIFIQDKPFLSAKRYAPIYFFIVGMLLADMIVIKGLAHFQIKVSFLEFWSILLSFGFAFALIGEWLIRRIVLEREGRLRSQFASTEKIFGILMGLTACAMVFAHGSNDVAIAVGPMAAVITIAKSAGKVLYTYVLPAWITLIGVTGVILGLLMYGRKIIETVGKGITNLTPSRAFSATIAAASTVVVSTSLGIPVSATQTLVGGILGVGLARGIGALNLRVVRNILMSWVITLPIGAGLAIGFFFIFQKIFSS